MSADNWDTCPACGEETFREDYEIYGAARGEITVDYSGRCTSCGCGLDFQHRHIFHKS